MKNKKRLIIAGISAVVAMSLSACTSTTDAIYQKILEDSGITENEDYQNVQKMMQSGQLNQDGQYKIPEVTVEAEENMPGSIQVSFGNNSYLNTVYYSDAERTQKITDDTLYLSPGDAIYAGDCESKNPHSNLYQLSEYRIYEYSMEGKLIQEYSQKAGRGNLLIMLTEQNQGHSFSIMPVGVYPNRKIDLSVFYKDDEGKTYTLEDAGTWKVNGEACTKKTVDISAVDSYVLSFAFDNNNYFFVDSTPECFTKEPNKTGSVEFLEEDPRKCNTDTYKIELREYIDLTVKTTEKAKVTVNDGIVYSVKKKGTWSERPLRYGDKVVVKTAGECIISGDDRHFKVHRDPVGNEYKYIITITEGQHKNNKNELPEGVTVNRKFLVTLDSACPHAECVYELDGQQVSGKVSVREGQILKLSAKITDDGYIFADKKDEAWYVSKTKNDHIIEIGPQINNTTLKAENYFDIVKKEAD